MAIGLAFRQVRSMILCAAVACATAYAQGKTKQGNDSTTDEYPDLVELDAFGGCSIWGTVNSGLREKLADGGTAGGRVAFNFSKHLGLELGYNFMINNVRLETPISPGLPSYNFGNQIHYFALNAVYNLTRRGSRVQPYVTVGAGPVLFDPTAQAEQHAKLVDSTYQSAKLRSTSLAALNYGAGIKFHLSEHFGLRFDARGMLSRNPTFGLPDYNDGGLYIVNKQLMSGFQGTLGLVFYLGQRAVVAPTPCQPAAPLGTPTISGAEGTICQGKPVTLHANLQAPTGDNLTYSWTLNGAAQQNATGPDFSFTPNNSGDFNVQVTITDTTPVPQAPQGCSPAAAPRAPVTATASVNVVDSTLTVSSVSAEPQTLSCRQPNPPNAGPYTAQLTANASAGACGGNLTYKWTVSEGSLSNDTSATANFDTTTLNFAPGATEGQTKTVTATVTVTDQNGKTASQSTPITVNCQPIPFVRLDDVVFAKNSARVNNCGKRILIDDVAHQITGDYDVVLVGHRTPDERATLPGRAHRTRGRRADTEAGQALDEARALNAAAVLTGGTGRCANVDLSHVKVDWVGTDQTSTPRPGLCGTSARTKQQERRGEEVTEADQNRRVEVYLVPRSSTAMPPAVKEVKPLPEREMKALGCPR